MNPTKISLSLAAFLLSTAQHISADPGSEADECNGPICKKEGIIAGSILGAIGLTLLAYCACKKANQNEIAQNHIFDNQQTLLPPRTTAVQMDVEEDAYPPPRKSLNYA